MSARMNLLGFPIDGLTLKEVGNHVGLALGGDKPFHIVTANPEILDEATRNPRLAGIIRQADRVTADGVGILLGARILGKKLPERVTGIELADHLFQVGAKEGWTFYFLGAAPGVAEKARDRMQKVYPGLKVVGCQHGYFRPDQEDRVVEKISQARPDIILVGLGSPRQDYFIQTTKDQWPGTVLIGVGGSFDVFSGQVQRAPEIFQTLKLEWLYRIVTDPKRWKRSLALPRFVGKVVWQRLRQVLPFV